MTDSMMEKLNNPIVFKPLSGDPGHGYEATFFIEICDAIWEAGRKDSLKPTQFSCLERSITAQAFQSGLHFKLRHYPTLYFPSGPHTVK